MQESRAHATFAADHSYMWSSAQRMRPPPPPAVCPAARFRIAKVNLPAQGSPSLGGQTLRMSAGCGRQAWERGCGLGRLGFPSSSFFARALRNDVMVLRGVFGDKNAETCGQWDGVEQLRLCFGGEIRRPWLFLGSGGLSFGCESRVGRRRRRSGAQLT